MLKRIAIIISSVLVLAAAVIGLVSAVKAGKSAGDEAVYYMAEVTEEGRLSIRLYDEAGKELISKTLEMKLPAFEGLYETDGVYYGVFSASDAEAASTRFVIVKYDDSFEETAICEVADAVTFDASSKTGVSLVKAGDMLWLSTVSGVRAGDDVFAADVTYMISAETMTVVDSMYYLYDAEMREVLVSRVYDEDGAVLAVMNDADENVILYRMKAENGKLVVESTECVFYASEDASAILEKANETGLVRIDALSEKTEDETSDEDDAADTGMTEDDEKADTEETAPEDVTSEENAEIVEETITETADFETDPATLTEEAEGEYDPDEVETEASHDGETDAELLPTEKEPEVNE